MAKIDVTSGGPIEGVFSIDLSKGPGAYEFRGARGTGKTTCISSIDWLAGHKVDVTLHDGEPSGKVEGFGVVAPIGGRKRRKGDFELDTIDAEKFSLTDLIDPPGKTPEVRDAHAIKALAVLSEAKADSAVYHGLAGGRAAFDALGVQETADPVLLATRVKTAYGNLAREMQNDADREAAHAASLEHVPDGLDMSQSSDLTTLETIRDERRDRFASMTIERENGIDKEEEASEAKVRLEKIRAEYSGPTVEDAKALRQKASDAAGVARAEVTALIRSLATARSDAERCNTDERVAQAVVEGAATYLLAETEVKRMAEQSVNYPGPDDIAEAGVSVNEATDAYKRGVQIRDVELNQLKAMSHIAAREIAKKGADTARNKAAQVFDILAQSLHTKHLEIHSVDDCPRLFVKHPKRGKTLFDRVNGLSDGERVDYTLRELLPHIKSPGLLPIPQRVWQDLQPTDRTALHAIAVEKGLFLFGAQVSDGELRVCYLGDE